MIWNLSGWSRKSVSSPSQYQKHCTVKIEKNAVKRIWEKKKQKRKVSAHKSDKFQCQFSSASTLGVQSNSQLSAICIFSKQVARKYWLANLFLLFYESHTSLSKHVHQIVLRLIFSDRAAGNIFFFYIYFNPLHSRNALRFRLSEQIFFFDL